MTVTIPVSPNVAHFLDGLTPAAVERAAWGGGTIPLELCAYVTDRRPPEGLVTSVRSLLFRGSAVMVLTSTDGSRHVLPGGRRRADESVEDTLQRELLEETGWNAAALAPLGFIHLHHLGPKTAGHRYPYPDAFQLVYHAEAGDYRPGELEDDREWEVAAEFAQVAEAKTIDLDPVNRAFLDAGLARRSLP